MCIKFSGCNEEEDRAFLYIRFPITQIRGRLRELTNSYSCEFDLLHIIVAKIIQELLSINRRIREKLFTIFFFKSVMIQRVVVFKKNDSGTILDSTVFT